MHSVKPRGFTLIELVLVIIIIGILAATVVPKFVDFRSQSIIATSENLKGAIKNATTLVYSKSLIQGVEKLPSAQVTIDGQLIEVVYGYPAGTQGGISAVIEFDEGDWANNQRDNAWHSRASIYSGAWVYWHGSFDENAGALKCYLRYRQSTEANALPVIDLEFSNC